MSNINFEQYGLNIEILKAIEILNFKNPTKVQEQVIPLIFEHKDIIVKSQTGSGKTAAFAIPLCQLINWDDNKPQALIITPTRELAVQVKEDIFNIGRFKRIKVCAVYGKSSFTHQEKELKQKTHIVVGTTGRIIDHLENKTLDISNIKYIVVDEADKMLEMGFIDQLKFILHLVPKKRISLLFSATMPNDISDLCYRYMNNPIFIEAIEQNKALDKIYQEKYEVEHHQKISLLKDIAIIENPDSCIIFCNTKQNVDIIYNELNHLNYSCNKIHGGMEQDERLRVMNKFKQNAFRYLIATDVVARGIDVDNVSLIINYDIPISAENYVHRIGRTGRINNTGKAISFVAYSENKYLINIIDYIKKDIPLKEKPEKKIIYNFKQEFILKNTTIPEYKKEKGADLNKEILKLHINAGKKTKMRATDVLGALCNIKNITANDIGIINILDVSTFVDILNNKGNFVFNELQNTPIKGRIRTISKAEF